MGVIEFLGISAPLWQWAVAFVAAIIGIYCVVLPLLNIIIGLLFVLAAFVFSLTAGALWGIWELIRYGFEKAKTFGKASNKRGGINYR